MHSGANNGGNGWINEQLNYHVHEFWIQINEETDIYQLSVFVHRIEIVGAKNFYFYTTARIHRHTISKTIMFCAERVWHYITME